MNGEKYKSRERMRIITKYKKEMIDEIQGLQADDEYLRQRYCELEEAFTNVLDAEAKYRVGL